MVCRLHIKRLSNGFSPFVILNDFGGAFSMVRSLIPLSATLTL